MEKQEILDLLKSKRQEQAYTEQIIAELEIQLLGKEYDYHDPNGFNALVETTAKTVTHLYFQTYHFNDKWGVRFLKGNSPGDIYYFEYKGWNLAVILSSHLNDSYFVTIRRYPKGTWAIDKSECLIEIANKKTSMFKAGPYIDFLVEKVFKPAIKAKQDDDLRWKMKRIERQQENFKLLSDF